MSQPGIGAMLHYLGGGSSKSASDYYGRKIVSAAKEEEDLVLGFEDGVKIAISDQGQSCCENRYMTIDDDLDCLVGNALVNIEAKEGAEEEGDWETHETCFIEIASSGGSVTLTNHNEHNGYYGGFGLDVRELNGPKT